MDKIKFHQFWKSLTKDRNAGRATLKKLVAADQELTLDMFF